MSKSRAAAPEPGDTTTGTLLLQAFQGFQRRLFERLAEHGQRGVRPKHGAVLANLDAEGTRPSVLAARAGMTPPAMGELIDELTAKGYVRRVPDPTDRRAKLVVPTKRALDRQQVVNEIVAGIEAEYRAALGAVAYAELRESVRALVRLTGSGSEVAQPRLRG
jgi:DNA-binding MarR family transcriptional regulator